MQSAFDKWIDWEDRPFWAMENDLESIINRGFGSNQYTQLPYIAKSLRVQFYGSEDTSLDAIHMVKGWVFRNFPAQQYGDVMLSEENGVNEKYYRIPGGTLLEYDSVAHQVGGKYHSHIFVNQRALDYSDVSVQDECSMVDNAELNRCINALQTVFLREAGNILTLPYDLHCPADGCVMGPDLGDMSRSHVCSDTWNDIKNNFKWALD